MTENNTNQIIADAINSLDELYNQKNWLNLKNDICSIIISPRIGNDNPKQIWLIVNHDLVLSYKAFPYRDTLLETGSALVSERFSNASFVLFDYEALSKYLDLTNRSSFELTWSIMNSHLLNDAFNHYELLRTSAMQINENQYKRVVKNYFFTSHQLQYMLKDDVNASGLILHEMIMQYMRLSCLLEWSYFPPITYLQSEFNLTELGKKYSRQFDDLLNLNQSSITDGHIDILMSCFTSLIKIAENRFQESPNWLTANEQSIYSLLTNKN